MYAFEDGECALGVKWGSDLKVSNLPCYPEEANEAISATWQEQPVIGRVGQLHAYVSTSDVRINFSFDMHREMSLPPYTGSSGNFDDIDKVIRLIKSACYPDYTAGLTPPRTMWKFGEMYISGILTEATFNWKLPIIQKRYAICTVGIQMIGSSRRILDKDDVLRGSDYNVVGGSIKKDLEISDTNKNGFWTHSKL